MSGSSNYFRSRSEQLADYLRDGIARGEITEPLPVTRVWSKTLNVSRFTLRKAVAILRREKLLSFQLRRTPHLRAAPKGASKSKDFHARMVRIIVFSRDRIYSLSSEWFFALSLRLSLHNIQVAIESCSDSRLRAISRRACLPNEVFLLSSLPSNCLSYFSHWTRNALIIGHSPPSSPLSYMTLDLEGAIRHAAQSLMRKGFARISLLTDPSSPEGVVRAIQVFEKACREWPRQPIMADCQRLSIKIGELRADARRFARKLQPRHGIIIMQPSFVSMIMTALMERNIVIPRDVEIYSMGTGSEGVTVCPPVTFYPHQTDEQIRIVAEAIFHFFETGSVPRMRKSLPMEAHLPDA